MSIPGAASPLFLATTAGAADAFSVSKSLRFNSGDSAYLNFTPSAAGNQKTWTWSGWFKNSSPLTGTQSFFAAGSNGFTFRISATGAIETYEYSGGFVFHYVTSALFRDPSAWYHIVLALDTTDSTASDRIKIYVNGSRITDFATSTSPSSGATAQVNNTVQHEIGNSSTNTYLNGYLAEVNFIDGQALAPTDFGETDDNGVWQAKEFTGSYTQEFAENWESQVTGSAIDAGRAISMTFDGDASTRSAAAAGTTLTFTPTSPITGISAVIIKADRDSGASSSGLVLNGTNISSNWSSGTYEQTISVNNLTSLSWQTEANSQWWGIYYIKVVKNGVTYELLQRPSSTFNSFRLPFTDNSSTVALGYDQKETVTLNPKGGMDVVTYTGNGGTQSISSLAFQPDFAWIKTRSAAVSHQLYDVVRGATKRLESNSTGAESTKATGLTSFNADGFTMGNDGNVNNSGATYVAWCWKAGGAAVSNTDGSITSQVSASTAYGFSVVSWTGNQTDGASVGHGLGSVPKLILAKSRADSTYEWITLHETSGTSSGFSAGNLNTTDTIVDISNGSRKCQSWHTAPTSSVFSLGIDGSSWDGTLNKSEAYIAYCWSEIAGFSKISSYAGSNSAQTIECGFKPAFVMIKCTTSANDWIIQDKARGSEVLYPNLSDAEFGGNYVSFTSTGFTLNTSDGRSNSSGDTYIYAAYAERPGNNWTPNNLSAGISNAGPYVSQFVSSTGFKTSYPAINAFDDSTSTYAQASTSGGTLTFTPSTGISYSSSIKIWMPSAGATASINGGSSVSVANSSEATIATGSGTLTSLVLAASNLPGLAYIKIDDQILTDSGLDTGNDSLVDSPTNGTQADTGIGGEVVGNYATLNPLATYTGTLSNGNLKFSTSGGWEPTSATIGVSSGKWYWEYLFEGTNSEVGITAHPSNTGYTGNYQGSLGIGNLGDMYYNGASSNPFSSFASGSIIGMELDLDNGTFRHYVNGVAQSYATQSLDTSLTWFPSGSVYGSSHLTYNFGQRSFAYTNAGTNRPSADFKCLTTANLPTSTIADGSKFFNTVIWSGDGSGAITVPGLSLNNAPGFVWSKTRNHGYHNNLWDVVRGFGSANALVTDENYVEGTADGGTLNSATSSSLTFSGGVWHNENSKTYVAWTWDGGTSTVTNNDGSIASQVRANASAGFSIVKWTGVTWNGSNPQTIGHGLNAEPEMMIIKNIDRAVNWAVYHKSIGNTTMLQLNTTGAKEGNDLGYWNNTTPTNSVFTVGNGYGYRTGGINEDFIGYIFAPVAGYSAMGSYSGGGTTNVFVSTGMSPKFIMIKCTNTAKDWLMFDTVRYPNNVQTHVLKANTSGQEDSTYNIDILSNGFTLRSDNSHMNASGNTYLYIAFASNPFQANGGLAR